MSVIKMTDLDLKGKRVLIREDLNVPQADDGSITDDTRIRASLPTIKYAMQAGAKLMLMSHLGRPEEGVYSEADSLKPIAKRLSELLGREVRVIKDWLDGGFTVADGEVVLFENVRFNKGEGKNNDELAQKMAKLCDIYVMDAFGTAHRAQASTHGVATAARAKGGDIPVPTDVVVGKKFDAKEPAVVKKVADISDDDMIFDIGPETAKTYAAYLKKAGTIVWNGPVGVFEFDQFGNGTKTLGMAIADSPAFSIAGGGDTLAAIAKYKIGDRVSYISTGGGAFLEFLEGKKLPAVEILEQRAAK